MDSTYKTYKIPLKTVLNVTALIEAALVFFMAYEAVGPVYSIIFLVLALAALLSEWLGLGRPPRLVVNLAALAGVMIIFTRVRRNYIVEALVEAILLMTAVKMFESKRARDYVQIAALGGASVVSYAMLSVEKSFILYALGMALVSTVTLLLSAWLDKDDAAAMSFDLLRQICVRAAVIFFVMLPLCLLLFFGLPRTAYPFFGRRGTYGSMTGFSDQVRLGDTSSIQANRKLAFRAETEELRNIPSPYWRGMTLDIFDGAAWVASGTSSGRGVFVPDPQAPRVEQEIFLEPGNQGYLFALDHPFSVTGVETGTNGEGSFRYTGRNVGRRLQYHAVSAVSPRVAPPSGQIHERRYLILPDNFMLRLAALTADIAQGSYGEKISAILGFLASPEFTYSLDDLPSGRNALERFIFEDKKGNCEYYASAMGVMLRMAGVPARLVGGYRGGVYNEAGGYYMVQEQNAHVWVEAWNGTLGVWERYDPTPPGYGAGSGDDELNVFESYLDFIDYQWSRLIVNYSLETQLDMARNIREAVRNPRAALTPTGDGFRRIGEALFVPAAILAALVVCAAAFYAVRAVRSRRPEMALLEKFLRVMKRNGYRKHDSEGLTEFLGRVDDVSLRAAASPFAREFQELYFRDGLITAPDLKQLKEYIKTLARYSPSARQ